MGFISLVSSDTVFSEFRGSVVESCRLGFVSGVFNSIEEIKSTPTRSSESNILEESPDSDEFNRLLINVCVVRYSSIASAKSLEKYKS